MLAAPCSFYIEVKDNSGAVFPDALISVTKNGERADQGSTNAEGRYRLVLREGTYTISIASVRFPLVERPITLTQCPDASVQVVPIVLGEGMIIDWPTVTDEPSIALEPAMVPTELRFPPKDASWFARFGRKLKSLLVHPKTA